MPFILDYLAIDLSGDVDRVLKDVRKLHAKLSAWRL